MARQPRVKASKTFESYAEFEKELFPVRTRESRRRAREQPVEQRLATSALAVLKKTLKTG